MILKLKIVIILSTTCMLTQSLLAQQYPVERIHLHVNKNIFVAGECCWFKAYCLNVQTRKTSYVSNVAYIELMNDQGVSIVQKSIILKNGMGNCGFKISEEVPSGYYNINSYTNWSRTISPELAGLNQIYIYNNKIPPKESDTKTEKIEDSLELKSITQSTKTIKLKNDQFLVTMQLTDLQRNIRFMVRNLKTSPQQLRFILSGINGIKLEEVFSASDSITILEIPLKKLPGYNQVLEIKNSGNEVLAKHCIHLDKTGFAKRNIQQEILYVLNREEGKLRFSLSDFSISGDTLQLSASIRLKEPSGIVRNSNMNVFSQVLLDFPVNSFTVLLNQKKLLNTNWISTSELQPFWSQLPLSCNIDASKYPEKNAYILEGKLLDDNGRPLKNTPIFFSRIGAFAEISPDITNENGQFYFRLPLQKGLHDISLQVMDHDSISVKYNLNGKFLAKGVGIKKMFQPRLKGKYLDFLKEIWENYKIRQIYNTTDYTKVNDSTIYRSEKNFFGKPDQSFIVDEYIRLDSLEEYFHELITAVKIRYRKKHFTLNVFNPETKSIMHESPLVLYDGLILEDMNLAMGLKSENIDRIEVVPYEYYYKSAHFAGIVHIISKNKKCELKALPSNTERYYLPLFVSEIQKADYQVPKQHYPDFRTDLLWVPNITLTKNYDVELEFTTSDVKGEYELVIEGISEKGEPIVLKQDILVE